MADLKCAETIMSVAKGAANAWFGGIGGTVGTLVKHNGNIGLGKALKTGFRGGDGKWDTIHFGRELDEDGNVVKPGFGISGTKVAGALSSLGIGYRFLSGGGLYRDKDGNTDIAGIPFI